MLTEYKSFFQKISDPIGRGLSKFGITPNAVTIASLCLTLAACLLFAWNKNAVLFGILALSFGLFDMLDGAVARVTNTSSKFGAYLDAMTDRITEAAIVIVTSYVSGYWFLGTLLITGLFLVSYAKARAGMEIAIQNNEWPDFMERTERGIIFITAVILWGLFPNQIFGHDILYWVMCLLVVFIFITVLQRFARARKLIRERQ